MYARFLKFLMLLGFLGLGAMGVGLYFHFRPESSATTSSPTTPSATTPPAAAPPAAAPGGETSAPGLTPAVSTALQVFRSGFVARFRATCAESARQTVQARLGSVPPAIETQIADLCTCSADYVMDQVTPEDVGEMTTSLLKGHGAQPTAHLRAVMTQAVPHCTGTSGGLVQKP